MKCDKPILNFCAYLLALIIFLFIFVFMTDINQFSVLLEFSAWQILVALFLSLGAYIGNGVEYYIICQKMGIRIEKKDILLLPLAMNLAGTVFPVQGAMTYQIFLMKKKYHAEISQGCSVAALLYMITITISGMTGIVFFFSENVGDVFFLLLSICFVGTPAWAIIGLLVVKKLNFSGRIGKFTSFVRRTLEGVMLILHDIKITMLLLVIYILRLLSMVLLFYWLAKCLNMNICFSAILLLNLWNMLSLLLKFTPNNLGVSQLISGIMFSMINLSESDGVILSLAATITFLIMAFSFGILSMACHFWQISRRPGPKNFCE